MYVFEKYTSIETPEEEPFALSNPMTSVPKLVRRQFDDVVEKIPWRLDVVVETEATELEARIGS